MEKNLDAEIKALLKKRHGEWRTLSDQSGVSYSWIAKFIAGHINNPGYGTLMRLRAILVPAKRKTAPKAKS